MEPTERSMPPVIITATWPKAMIAMKAKLRVLLTKFSPLKKARWNDGSTSVIAMGMMTTAIITQNGCFEMIFWRNPVRGPE